MSRKLWSVALALGVVAGACGSEQPGAGEVPVEFVRETVDFLDSVGFGASISVDAEGIPHVTYVGVTEEIEEGEIPVARPASAPALPAILSAFRMDGAWHRGLVVESDITGLEPKLLPITTRDETASVVDADSATHVVWTREDGLYYSSAPSGGNEFEPAQLVFEGDVTGPSISIDARGTPLVTFYTDTENRVLAATPPPEPGGDQGEGGEGEGEGGDEPAAQGPPWNVVEVAEPGPCVGCPDLRTAVANGPQGPVIAYTDGPRGPALATETGEDTAETTPWTSQPLRASGGFGLAMATDGSAITFLTPDGQVQLVSVEDGTPGEATTVGRFSVEEPRQDLGGGTAIAAGGDVTYVAWTDPEDGTVRLAADEGNGFEEVDTPGTGGGSHPALAVGEDGKAYLAWYDVTDEDLAVGIYPEEVDLLARPAPSEGGGGVQPPTATCEPDGTELQISALGLAFDTDCLAAPAGEPFTIVFENGEAVVHNVAIVENLEETPIGEGLFVGDPVNQPDSVTYDVGPLDAGDYFFRCDFHAGTMIGTFIVQ